MTDRVGCCCGLLVVLLGGTGTTAIAWMEDGVVVARGGKNTLPPHARAPRVLSFELAPDLIHYAFNKVRQKCPHDVVVCLVSYFEVQFCFWW